MRRVKPAMATIIPIDLHERAWALFFLFGQIELDAGPEDWANHLMWIRRHGFKSPDAWLGPRGDRYREPWGMNNPSAEFVQDWSRFQAAHAADTLADIDKLTETFLHDAGSRPPAGGAH